MRDEVYQTRKKKKQLVLHYIRRLSAHDAMYNKQIFALNTKIVRMHVSRRRVGSGKKGLAQSRVETGKIPNNIIKYVQAQEHSHSCIALLLKKN